MAQQEPASRATITVARETFDILARLEQVLPASKAEMVTALARWFERVPPEMQAAILDPRRSVSEELARLKLVELATGASGPASQVMSFDQAATVAKLMIERMAEIQRLNQQALAEQIGSQTKSGGNDDSERRNS